MVSRITLLEPHFEGAQFGPSNLDSGTFEGLRETSGNESSTVDGSSREKSRGMKLIQGLIGFVILFAVLYVSFQMLSSENEDSE